jgi:hypothetical protein
MLALEVKHSQLGKIVRELPLGQLAVRVKFSLACIIATLLVGVGGDDCRVLALKATALPALQIPDQKKGCPSTATTHTPIANPTPENQAWCKCAISTRVLRDKLHAPVRWAHYATSKAFTATKTRRLLGFLGLQIKVHDNSWVRSINVDNMQQR